MEIQIYGMRLERELSDGERELLMGCLPYARYQRLSRSRESKQNQAMCAYGLLRYALGEQYGLEELPEIVIGREGKPAFRERPDIQFNLSHTSGAVLCVLHDHPVGVDIEQEREAARTMLHYYRMEDQGDFWRMWVRREATAKCQGRGIAALPHWDSALETGVDCRPLELFPGYFAAVATPEREAAAACHVVTLERLVEALAFACPRERLV